MNQISPDWSLRITITLAGLAVGLALYGQVQLANDYEQHHIAMLNLHQTLQGRVSRLERVAGIKLIIPPHPKMPTPPPATPPPGPPPPSGSPDAPASQAPTGP